MKNQNEILELVLKLREGDVDSFNSIYNLYNRSLFSFAYSIIKSRDDAKEILQETFIKIWCDRNKINPQKPFKSFLFTIAHNLIIDLLRKRMNEEKYKQELSVYIKNKTEDEDNNDIILEKERNIIKIIDTLPDRRKEIFKLSRFRGFSHKEIAHKLNISTKTIEAQISSAIKSIRKELQKSHNITIILTCIKILLNNY